MAIVWDTFEAPVETIRNVAKYLQFASGGEDLEFRISLDSGWRMVVQTGCPDYDSAHYPETGCGFISGEDDSEEIMESVLSALGDMMEVRASLPDEYRATLTDPWAAYLDLV